MNSQKKGVPNDPKRTRARAKRTIRLSRSSYSKAKKIDQSLIELGTEPTGGLDARFCEVMDAAPVMIWVSGKDKGCVWFNKPWLTFTGRRLAQEVGKGWSEGVHHDDFDRCLEVYSTHFGVHKDFRMQYRLRRHDGAYRWIDDTGIPRFARDGSFLGYIGSCVDVHDHREAQAERNRVWHHSRDLLGIAGIDGIIHAANPAWTEILGYTSDEVIGRSYLDFVFPEDAHLAGDIWQTMVSGHNLTDFQIRLRCKDGAARWISWNSRTQGGLFYGYGRDITAAKAQEQALADAERALRRRLVEIAELSRRTYAAMLVGSIVQEINQPLAAMVSDGNAGLRWLAKDTPDVQRARSTFNNIVRAGLRAGEIVDRIRTISKEESCLRAPANLNDLVREALVLVENELQDHRIAVRSTLNEMIPKVLADRVQLQHVILNLIKNAIEAMGSVVDGQRLLHIETEFDGSQNIILTVQDSGAGIDPEDVERIFDRFFTTKTDGERMGLPICRSIIEAHNGRLWVEPGIHQGSLFRISLPTAPE